MADGIVGLAGSALRCATPAHPSSTAIVRGATLGVVANPRAQAVDGWDWCVGEWVEEGGEGDVAIAVAVRAARLAVQVRSLSDNERAEVYQVRRSRRRDEIRYCTYFRSTGRFAECALRRLPGGAVTHTVVVREALTLERRAGLESRPNRRRT